MNSGLVARFITIAIGVTFVVVAAVAIVIKLLMTVF
jgi:hypothetical protein